MLGEGLSTEIEWKDSRSNENLKRKSWRGRKCWCCETLWSLSRITVHWNCPCGPQWLLIIITGMQDGYCRNLNELLFHSERSTLWLSSCPGGQRSLTDRRRTVKDVSYVLPWLMWSVRRGGGEICATGGVWWCWGVFLDFLFLQLLHVISHLSSAAC